MIVALVGGIGVFLFGMSLMTDGLKSLGSGSIRSILEKFTSNRFNSVFTGFFITAIIQSSSVTALMTLGFVSAELISLPSALGIVLGASLGTTVKGWLVATVGLKIEIAAFSYPVIYIAAFMKLFGSVRVSQIGTTLAGFALILMGIGFMQTGMSNISTDFNMEFLSAHTLWGRMLLMGVGTVMSIVMLSSSAAVASTITAVHASAVSLPQAEVLIIGQAVGATIAAVLGAFNSGVHAKRTAAAFVLFNLLTALLVILFFPLFTSAITVTASAIGITHDAVILSFFYTSFILLEILIFLPVIRLFANLLTRVFPDKIAELTLHLDEHPDQLPSIALVGITETLADIGAAAFARLKALIVGGPEKHLPDVIKLENALNKVKRILSNLKGPSKADQQKALDAMHCYDHVLSLIQLCRESDKALFLRNSASLSEMGLQFLAGVSFLTDWLERESAVIDVGELEALSKDLANLRKDGRKETFELAARAKIDLEHSLTRIEAIRWLDRMAYHLWRMTHHLVILRDKEK